MELMSPSIANLSQALALAQSEFKAAIKDSRNSHLNSKYADLANVIEASRPALTKQALAVMQVIVFEDNKMFLRTILSHKTGEFVSGMFLIKPIKDDPQGVGSAITYARRYSYAAICGVITDDDDGEGAHGRRYQPPPASADIYQEDPEQRKILFKILTEMELPTDKEYCKNISSIMMGKKLSQAKLIINDYLENK